MASGGQREEARHTARPSVRAIQCSNDFRAKSAYSAPRETVDLSSVQMRQRMGYQQELFVVEPDWPLGKSDDNVRCFINPLFIQAYIGPLGDKQPDTKQLQRVSNLNLLTTDTKLRQ